MVKILFVMGTRPEAVKLAPVIRLCLRQRAWDIRTVLTGQHGPVVRETLGFFGVKPDHELGIVKKGMDLSLLTAACLSGLRVILKSEKPGLVVVQGDTAATMAGAMAAFHEGIPVAYVEAGLRSYDKKAPYPEETYRRITTLLAEHFFVPDRTARDNLLAEKIPAARIHLTGNTVVDSLFFVLSRLERETKFAEAARKELAVRFDRAGRPVPVISVPAMPVPAMPGPAMPGHRTSGKYVIVTGHGRENIGSGLRNLAKAVRILARKYPETMFVWLLHFNPASRKAVEPVLRGAENIALCEPLSYPAFCLLLKGCRLVITDSGGLQEEAPCLGKPVLVARDVTERVTALRSGGVVLCGTGRDRVVNLASRLLNRRSGPRRTFCYGRGHSAERILGVLKKILRPAGRGTD